MDKIARLPQPPLVDFSKLSKDDQVRIIICNQKHKFATDAAYSGLDPVHQPIFGSKVYINGKKFSKSSFGLPPLRFPQGSTPKITYVNKTKFTFNIHHHGLNTIGSLDGTSMEVVFGPSTLLGPEVTFDFPLITNNQCLLWNHSHNMFVSMYLIYGGIVGLIQITDCYTKWLTEAFEYGNNNLLLTALDMDLQADGTQTSVNLVSDENRSCFTVVNGVSAVNWYSSDPVPFVNPLSHKTNNNLVKIDILNASLNWRVFYLGVCDRELKIQSFYLVQTDTGLINPYKLKVIPIPVAGRIGIIIDVNDFRHQEAYFLFYNYDLTEVFDSKSTFPDQPNNPTITGTIPNLKYDNSTPYPTPIPGPSNLTYPPVNPIPESQEVLDNGSIKVPKKSGIKIFLKIELDGCSKNSLDKVIDKVRKTVLGKYQLEPCFEYNPKINYLSYLNKEYFYNLPDHETAAVRNIFLFPEADTNSLSGGNPNGTTEYVNGANRIMVDLWNSDGLNLDWALAQYALAPNNYKPPTLPTSTFRIYKTNDQFSNTAMISNDTLKVQIFKDQVAYGDMTKEPWKEITIVFPATKPCTPLNIEEWINLVNWVFIQNGLGQILQADWSFFPYALNFLYQKTKYVKSAVIKTQNQSKYWIRLLGRWPLLQFFW